MSDSPTRTLNSDLIKDALIAAGLTQDDLASELEVSGQAVTNWLKGKNFPRPPKLLKMSIALSLSIENLVLSSDNSRPIVAFRKKGSSKTTLEHVKKAEHVGMLLRPLAHFLPNQNTIRPVFSSTVDNANAIGKAADQTREKLGVGLKSTVKYNDLISEFGNSGAVLVPVMWGPQEKHKNALHIHLPAEGVTFIFLNLDTRIEDFKFWMAHELAHVYTPHLSGTEEGEDFADAFAGNLLFSNDLSIRAYKQISALPPKAQADSLRETAEKHQISIFTVYSQVKKFAVENDLPKLAVSENKIHEIRNARAITSALMSESLFKNNAPTVTSYLKICEIKFETAFFEALRGMIIEREVAAGYLQQVMSISHAEAKELHRVLMK